MKKISLIAILLIAVMMIVGCSHNAEVSKNADESESISFSANITESESSKIVTENESSTQISTTEITTTQTTIQPNEKQENTTAPTTFAKADDKKSAGQTTPKKVTTTHQQTTTKKQTTTQKVATTQKQTTTKKVTTTSAPYWCDEGGTHHSCEVGQIGWVNSYDEAEKKALDYAGKNDNSGGFLVKECHNCGKFTAIITFD